jgi:hypothetical protein
MGSKTRVRPATRADVAQIKAMIREFADYLNAIDEPEEPEQATIDRIEGAAFGPKPLCRILVAEAGGRMAGYLVYFIGLDMDLVLPPTMSSISSSARRTATAAPAARSWRRSPGSSSAAAA